MLIKCPECELQVSDKAMNCPHCGYPLKDNTLSKVVKKTAKKHRKLPNGCCHPRNIRVSRLFLCPNTAFYGGIRAKCLRSLQNFFYIIQSVLGRKSYADVIRSD